MPLQDHFRPPLSHRRWSALYSAWATCIAADLNRQLPKGFFAEPNVTFDVDREAVEVAVYEDDSRFTVAGAIVLVTPPNKEHRERRKAFLNNCVEFLRNGAGLVTVDVVTHELANLHDELIVRLGQPIDRLREGVLLTSAYRVVERNAQSNLEVWHETLTVGKPLPTMPLWLKGANCIPVDLESTYEQTCKGLRIS